MSKMSRIGQQGKELTMWNSPYNSGIDLLDGSSYDKGDHPEDMASYLVRGEREGRGKTILNHSDLNYSPSRLMMIRRGWKKCDFEGEICVWRERKNEIYCIMMWQSVAEETFWRNCQSWGVMFESWILWEEKCGRNSALSQGTRHGEGSRCAWLAHL